jgi:radical SAM-linked protein
MIPKSWFQEDWARAQALEHAPDCRHSNCHRCGVIDVERELCAHMLRDSIAGAKEEGTWTPRRAEAVDPMDRGATTAPLGTRIASNGPPSRVEEPPALQRVRFRVGRTENMRFLSHLETANAWIRALRRAKAPLSFTQGFHAHARVNFSTAMPTAEASVGDYMDVVLCERVNPFDLVIRLGEVLPRGLSALSAEEVPLRSPSLMSLVDGHVYTLHTTGVDAEILQERIERLWDQETWTVRRQAKRRGRKVQVDFDVKPTVTRLVIEGQGKGFHVAFETRAFSGRLGKAREILELLGLSNADTQVFKRQTLLRDLPRPEADQHEPV